jgi:hypothetical protein
MRATVFLLGLAASTCASAEPFVFRGDLQDGGKPAEGAHELRLTLYAHPAAQLPLAGPLELTGVVLQDGRFAVDVDFGALPAGVSEGWLEVAVRAQDEGGALVTLPGRERVALKAAQICPASWALAGNADTNAAVDFLGTTTAQPLVLRGNNQRVAYYESIPLTTGTTANVVLGAAANSSAPGVRGASIGGGGSTSGGDDDVADDGPNQVFSHYATVAGGNKNRAGEQVGDGDFASIGGGLENLVLADAGHVGGGYHGTITAAYGTIGGGFFNVVQGERGTIAGGENNFAQGASSAVAGGVFNFAAGVAAGVPGGNDNCAGGDLSLAAGHRAKVRPGNAVPAVPGTACAVATSSDADGDEGSFVWADSQNADFLSSGPNQFAIRAAGGVRLNNDTDLHFGADARQMLNLFQQNYGIGVQSGTLYFRSGQRFAWFEDGAHDDDAIDPGTGGTLLMTLGIDSGTPTGTARAQTFTSVSSRHVKTAFASIDAGTILSRVLALPLSEWSYVNAPERRHIGPMSQDFHAAFGLNGADDEAIATVDADGVALAAIQGLNAKLEAELAALRAEMAQLRAALEQR